ncbi:hypothetical protein Tco_1461149 [Tanacetum coccineum]
MSWDGRGKVEKRPRACEYGCPTTPKLRYNKHSSSKLDRKDSNSYADPRRIENKHFVNELEGSDTSLSIHDVIIVPEIDHIIIHLSMSNCVKEFTLETLTIDYELPSSFFKFTLMQLGDNEKEAGDELTCVELLECLPCVTHLELSKYYIKYFVAGDMLHKFPTLLVPLKSLNLEVCFLEPDEFCFAICLIKSSPELEKLALKKCKA